MRLWLILPDSCTGEFLRFAMELVCKGSSKAEKTRIISPTPSSLCPTESTAVGCAELYDLEEEERPTSRCTGEVRSWTQVSERLRGLFHDLTEEDLEESDCDEAAASPAFSSILAEDKVEAAERCDLPEVENVSWRDWQGA
mmetsp:Transcript_24299/g.28637  ORF Transcript_24299/g.28637 Transcript_24299/m.28637 type:complete len:141 (-) Transcript_24299:1-423(-)